MFQKPVILIDTREQRPLNFSRFSSQFQYVCRATLHSGDYSFYPKEDRVSFERKSLSDLVNTLAKKENRERFFREMERLKDFEYAAIIVEANFEEVMSPYRRSKMNPASVVGLLQAIQVRYDIDVIYSGSRFNSEEIIMRKVGALYDRP